MISLSLLDVNVKRAVFSASAIMTILCGLFILSKIFLYIFAGIALIGTGILAFDLFLKKYIKKK